MTAKIRDLGRPGDLGWVVMAHGEVYAREFGWDQSFETLVARIVADYAETREPAKEAAWIAELDDRRVGSVFLVRGDAPGTAKLRILLVDPAARRHGLGAALVAECIAFARAAGYARVTLWTNDNLVAARKIYQAAGFVLDHEYPHRSFGHDLTGQTWSLPLRPDA